MARFIIDIANLSEIEIDNFMEELTDNTNKIITIHCIEKTNDNQFHEENHRNRLSEKQIQNTGGHRSVDAYTEMALEEQLEDLEKQLDEIYESVVGDEGRERYTHEEFIQRLLDIYDDSQIFQRMEAYRDKRVSSD